MSRADRIVGLLSDGAEHCSYFLYRQLPGFPARAVNEAKRRGVRFESRMCQEHHGYKVYRLEPQQLVLPLTAA